jgi:hypothetical protein
VTVVIDTLVRTASGDLRPIRELDRYDGDPAHVEGAVVMAVDGAPILSAGEWDDIDYLWAYLVQAADACRRTGAGECSFPDQPITFRAQRLGTGRLLLAVQIGDERRTATPPDAEFYRALAAAGSEFFEHHRRLVRGSGGYEREAAILRSWD